MKIVLFLFGLWIPSAFCVVIKVKPEVPPTREIRALRTTTTITLTKPICVFTNGTVVDVFGVQATVNSIPNAIGNSSIRTYQQTKGGATGPYRAASFGIPTCTSSPFMLSTDPLRIQAEIDEYLFRVGDDVQCLRQINPPNKCNAPLTAGVKYRFKYAVRNGSTNVYLTETLWSDSIALLEAPGPTVIDPAGRSTGGMVVITTILVILLFLLLCAFVTLLMSIFCLRKEIPAVEQRPTPVSYVAHKKHLDFSQHMYAEASKPAVQQSSEERYQPTIESIQGSE
ncbi:uroplakin-3a-like [Carcharodon carcharias]|uniref:uroplakin-3a-like n=1 Tax=Carcharodon carcharias TaxID=13397 RepID=UPI001B7F6397|nr:uroplakin-3a-like [Carcharodon carcharias]